MNSPCPSMMFRAQPNKVFGRLGPCQRFLHRGYLGIVGTEYSEIDRVDGGELQVGMMKFDPRMTGLVKHGKSLSISALVQPEPSAHETDGGG